jgi:uncharacterized membrane protein
MLMTVGMLAYVDAVILWAGIGVRTPWARANERVWNATHRVAAKTFLVGGLAGLALLAVGVNGWPPFVAMLVGALIPVPYSLYCYKQLERRGEL